MLLLNQLLRLLLGQLSHRVWDNKSRGWRRGGIRRRRHLLRMVPSTPMTLLDLMRLQSTATSLAHLLLLLPLAWDAGRVETPVVPVGLLKLMMLLVLLMLWGVPLMVRCPFSCSLPLSTTHDASRSAVRDIC